jgi:hypothetical protein
MFPLGIGGLTGSPIIGALLTDNFIWWRPAVFSGVSITLSFVRLQIPHRDTFTYCDNLQVLMLTGTSCFIVVAVLLHRRKAERAKATSA